jgi:glycosyltransferase involved in cell wall biosynthesis
MKFNKSISVIIPSWNEDEIIYESSIQTLKLLDELYEDYEIVLVDDCSTDKTLDEITKVKNEHPKHVIIVKHEKNQGVGVGILSGVKAATKDYLMTNFADLPFHTKDLSWIFKTVLDKNADGCVMIRKDRSANPQFRKLTSYTNYLIIKTLFGMPFRDYQFVQLYRSDLLKALYIESRDLFIPPEIMFKLNQYGYYIIQEETIFHRRPGGEAKYGKIKYYIRTFCDHLKYFVKFKVLRIHMKTKISLPSHRA